MISEAVATDTNFDSEEHEYIIPTKRINDEASLRKFQGTGSAVDLMMFIVECQKAVKGTKMTET